MSQERLPPPQPQDCLISSRKSRCKGGTIIVLGVFGRPPSLDMASVGEHELSLVGTLMYRREDYAQAIEWMAHGGIQTRPLESRHFALADYVQAYRFIEEQGERSMKVFIDLC